MKKILYPLHPIFRCLDSAIFFDFVEYVLRTYDCELFDIPQSDQLYYFAKFRLYMNYSDRRIFND